MRMPPLFSRRAIIAGGGALALPLPSHASSPIDARIVREDGRLWIAASIDGGAPLSFVIDTGAAGNVIRPEIAKRLKLPTTGAGMIGGIGGQRTTTGVVEARNVLIGAAARQPRMVFSTYDFGRGLAEDAAGLLAAGLFTALDSDVSIEQGRWRFWPKGRPGAPDGMRIEDSLISERPGAPSQRIRVQAMLDGRPYRLLVDTGAPRGLILLPRASRRSGLFDGRPFAPRRISGFGGASDRLARLVRADRLVLGPLNLRRPFVTAMDPDQALGLDVDGILGLPLIALFDFATDVSANRLWLKRNTTAPAAEDYPRSGLWLRGGRDAPLTVEVAAPGSPAAAAGIAAGDVIVAPATFADALRAINGPAGSEVMLTVERGGVRAERRIVLADYL